MAAAVVVVLGTVATAALQDQTRPPDAWAFALIVLAALALAWRRRAHAAVLGMIVALVSGYLLIGYPYGPVQLCMVFAMFEVARLRRLRISLLACGSGHRKRLDP